MDFLKLAVPLSFFALEICSVHKNGVEVQTKLIGAMFSILQGVPRELTKSIGLLLRPGSIPGPIIRGEKFTDARTF